MLASPEEIRDFLAQFRDVSFPHASEVISLFDGVTEGVMIQVTTCASLEELRMIYRVRAEHLASRQLPSTFPKTLPEEVRALADAFDGAQEQPVRIWDMAFPGGRVLVVFELVEAHRIAGVVESADQRIVAT